MALFRAKEIRQGATEDELRRQLNEAFKLIERDLGAALSPGKMSEVITAATYAPGFGEVARVAPPSTGLALILPEPNLARLGERVNVVQMAASGAMTVEVVNGTINGAATLAYLAGVGTVEFILTPEGWFGWSVSLVASLPLTALAAQIAESFIGNFTASSAPPTARAGSSVAGAGLTYTAGGTLAVGAGTGLTVNANDVAVTIPLTDGDKGDVTVASSGTAWSIDSDAVTNTKLANMTQSTIKGRAAAAGTGDPTDLTGAQVGDILETEALTWTATQTFSGELRLGTLHNENAVSGSINITLTAGASRIRVGSTGATTIGTISGAADGRVAIIEHVRNSGAGDLTLTHAVTSNGIACPGSANLTLTGDRSGCLLVCRDDVWRVIAHTN